MPTLVLSPSWRATPKTKVPMHSIVLGDGYGIDSDVYQSLDEDYQIEKTGINENELSSLLLQIRQFAGVDEFDWSPEPSRYPLKKYRMPSHSVTKIGLGYYKISASLRRTSINPLETLLQTLPTITSVSPSSTAVRAGDSSQLSAIVNGTGIFSRVVNWTVQPGSTAVGTISILADGAIYTAPVNSEGLVSILRATSAQDSSKFGEVTITIQAPIARITAVVASSTTVRSDESGQLSAIISGVGSFSSEVVWSIQPSSTAFGTISILNGVLIYTAPNNSVGLTSILRATSAQDPSKFGEVTITIQPLLTGITSVEASADVVRSGGSGQLSAIVIGIGVFSDYVDWSIEPSSTAIGIISDSNGVIFYTAPANSTGLISILRATSAQDSSKFGEVAITIQAPIASEVTGITASASPNNISANSTAQLTAQVSGTGSFSTDVTWTVISGGGSISYGMFGIQYLASSTVETVVLRASSTSTLSVQTDVVITVQAAAASEVTGITASASPTNIAVNSTAQLTAQVSGTGNFSSGVTWVVISGGGSISYGMFGIQYLASSTVGTVVLRASSTSTPSVQTDVVITVQAAVAASITNVSASASPTSLSAGGISQLNAQVTGTGNFNSGVTWIIVSGGGSISYGMFGSQYTAGSISETVILKATSVQDSTKYAQVSIAITN